jgi:hypothetical protein
MWRTWDLNDTRKMKVKRGKNGATGGLLWKDEVLKTERKKCCAVANPMLSHDLTSQVVINRLACDVQNLLLTVCFVWKAQRSSFKTFDKRD